MQPRSHCRRLPRLALVAVVALVGPVHGLGLGIGIGLGGIGFLGGARALAAEDTVLAQSAEVRALEASLSEVLAQRALAMDSARGELAEIARLKASPPGLARDARLGQLLAASRERGLAIEHAAAAELERRAALLHARESLATECAEALRKPSLGAARRAELVVLLARTRAEIDREARAAALPIGIAPTAPVDPLAGPAELADRADRMKDDEEKLRREEARVNQRLANLESRRRLQESAAALGDDLWNESAVGRAVRRPLVQTPTETGSGAAADKATTSFGSGGAATPSAPSAGGVGASNGLGGGTGGAGGGNPQVPASPTTPATMLRGVVDPSTFGELQRAESSDDPELELSALRHAQRDLRARADELARREAELRHRASELRDKK